MTFLASLLLRGVSFFVKKKRKENRIISQIEIIVRDEGRGLTDEQRLRAFDRFWRNSIDSNKRQGSGLGLAIVAQLAQAGGLSVELRESPKGGVDAVLIIPGSN